MALRWIDNNPFNESLPVWTRAYASELFPAPVTPLGWDIVWDGGALAGWRDAMVDRMGFRSDTIDEGTPELLGVFGGYAYLNVSLLRIWAARTPALAPNHIDTAYLHEHRDLPVYVPAPWHRDDDATRGALTRWLSWVLADRNQSELEAGHLLSVEARAGRPDLGELSDGELVERALSFRPLCRALASHHLNQTLAASIGPGIVAAVCDEIGLTTSATALISGLGDVDSVSPAHAMWTLSRMVRESAALEQLFSSGLTGLDERLRTSDEVDVISFVAGLDALSVEVGFRGNTEWEPSGLTWEGDPETALAAIDQLRTRADDADPGLGFATREAERRTLVKEIGDAVADRPVTKDHFDAAVAATDTFVRGRERAKANLGRVIHEVRMALRELGQRAAGRGDVAQPADLHMLFSDELVYYADGGLASIREITDERRAHHRWLQAIEPPFIIKAEPDPIEVAHPPSQPPSPLPVKAGDALFGTPGSAGVGRGRARIVSDVAHPPPIESGEVLVGTSIPAMGAPLFIGAAAIVVESGGVLSHAAIISREIGIPMVVRVAGATSRIAEGALIEVDGATGVVTILEDPAPLL